MSRDGRLSPREVPYSALSSMQREIMLQILNHDALFPEGVPISTVFRCTISLHSGVNESEIWCIPLTSLFSWAMLTESRTGKELVNCSKLGFFMRLLTSAISPAPFQSIGKITACQYRWSPATDFRSIFQFKLYPFQTTGPKLRAFLSSSF